MPTYKNNLAQPVYFGDDVFVPNQEIKTFNTLDNVAFVVGSVLATYDIQTGISDVLYIRFNQETTWTVVTLTSGGTQAVSDIVTDINTAYGATVASDDGQRVRISAPVKNNVLSAVYIGTVGVGSTAAATLGLTTDAVNPVSLVALQAFVYSSHAQTYNITANNNTFIFKVNNYLSWITATLTIGATQTAADIVADINLAYETATADTTKIASAIVPVTAGSTYVKLAAPIYNNFRSKLYIKSTDNTALSVLGFSGDDFKPIVRSRYPSLVKISELPMHNPMLSETLVTFAAAVTQNYYLINPERCRELSLCRVSGGGGIKFTVYLEDVSNTPPYTLVVLESVSINLEKIRITKLVITSNGVGTITVRELIS